mmetsp:Transcript_7643/g.30259  ORF Transcript_7643/g.30259 Transcript_7643/m.30259 type:complete len:204 (+) Transcript_7643:523-1134(+)
MLGTAVAVHAPPPTSHSTSMIQSAHCEKRVPTMSERTGRASRMRSSLSHSWGDPTPPRVSSARGGTAAVDVSAARTHSSQSQCGFARQALLLQGASTKVTSSRPSRRSRNVSTATSSRSRHPSMAFVTLAAVLFTSSRRTVQATGSASSSTAPTRARRTLRKTSASWADSRTNRVVAASVSSAASTSFQGNRLYSRHFSRADR